jgi:hypothetical protein
MRQFINILNEANNRWDGLRQKYDDILSRTGKSVQYFIDLDPTPTKKFVQWLVKVYIKEPFQISYDELNELSKLPNIGDINSYQTFDDFMKHCDAIMEKSKSKVEGEVVNETGNLRITMVDDDHFGDKKFYLYMGQKRIGTFVIDLEFKKQGFVSIHSHINDHYQRRGFGTMVYKWITLHLAKRGLKLRASPMLTDASRGLWAKLDPEAMKIRKEKEAQWEQREENWAEDERQYNLKFD